MVQYRAPSPEPREPYRRARAVARAEAAADRCVALMASRYPNPHQRVVVMAHIWAAARLMEREQLALETAQAMYEATGRPYDRLREVSAAAGSATAARTHFSRTLRAALGDDVPDYVVVLFSMGQLSHV